ncbi:MAG TPA: LPS assembly protein LptD [Thermoanaerobaculia bacterium]|nr:LPS assembly protein LptD [Thermoanaerobaculia bacterium]
MVAATPLLAAALLLAIATSPASLLAQEPPPPAQQPAPPQTPEEPSQAPATTEPPATPPTDAPAPADETTPAPAPPSPSPIDLTAPATAPEGRLRFEVTFEDEETGGGKAVALAEELQQEGEAYILIGQVEIYYQDVKITADRAELDRDNKVVTATGNIIVDQGPSRLTGATASYNLDDKTGVLTDARGFVSTDYFFSGKEVRKTGDRTYTVIDGVFTSCAQDVPPWSFKAHRTNIVVDGYARTHGASMRVRNVPVIYFPYMLWPVKPERSSGFLVPKPGYSARRGGSLGLAYYQTIGPSFDTTLNVDLFSESYLGIGNEIRYQPSEGTAGIFRGYWIDDPDLDEDRWHVELDHESDDLPLGFRGVVTYEDVSDFDYFLDFEREARQNSQRQLYSNGFLTKNWGRQSLNILVDQRETFFEEDTIVELRQLPEIEYQLRSTQLGELPLYLQMRSALHYLDVKRREDYESTYGRAHLFPQLTLPFRAFPWLSLSVDALADITWWEDSLFTDVELDEQDEPTTVFRGEGLTRVLPGVSTEVVGPSLSRIYTGGGKYFSKFKHVVEPRFAYAYLSEYDDRDRVARFDEIDVVNAANLGRVSLINRVLAKPADEKKGSGREILSLEIFRLYSFDDETPLQLSRDGTKSSSAGPPSLLLRFNPSQRTNLRQEVAYNTLFGRIESTSTSGSLGIGPHLFGVRWTTRINPDDGQTRANQVRVSSDVQLVPDRLRWTASANVDATDGFLQLQRHIVEYTGSCYTMRLEYGEFSSQNDLEKDREFRFSLSLKNVGTFLDFGGGEHEDLQ